MFFCGRALLGSSRVQVNAFCGYAVPMDPKWLGTAPNSGATIWPLVCFDRVRTRYNPELKYSDTQKKSVRNDGVHV